MENFLKSKKGKMITFLTRACYYDLPYDENIDMTKFTSEEQFPEAFSNYVHFLEEYLETPIKVISIGPDREQTIVRK